MGAGASVSAEKELSTFKEMRAKFEELKADGKTDEDIYAELKTLYNTASPPAAAVAGDAEACTAAASDAAPKAAAPEATASPEAESPPAGETTGPAPAVGEAAVETTVAVADAPAVAEAPPAADDETAAAPTPVE